MLRVYGSRISYYTGKLEAYLRYRGLEYELSPTVGHEREIRAGAGAVQMPVVRLEDGRWMSDSTPMLAWLDARREEASTDPTDRRRKGTSIDPTDARPEEPSIYPTDPALRFVALLLEDHADEWLWRPAMHYRWSHLQDRQHASGVLADELLGGVRLPRFAKRFALVRRQRGGFVRGDGVSAATRDHVEGSALAAFEQLAAILAERPFLLGDRPTIADFGFMGPMFRHFGMDPTPAELMRQHAPRVYVWVARMWEARPSPPDAELVSEVDPPLARLLREICETHLVQLRENARAHAQGLRRYAQEIQGCRYQRLPVSRYRVWCLEELRRLWRELEEPARARLRPFLPEAQASVLWDHEPLATSGYDPERRAPFHRAINVFGTGVPD
jgi:glutathione S-transferase